MDFETFKKDFADKLRELRNSRNISAREMSLSLGQNVNYVNYIENGRHLPSMQGFFSICEYLDIQPAEFFKVSRSKSDDENDSLAFFVTLTERQRKVIVMMIKEFMEVEG